MTDQQIIPALVSTFFIGLAYFAAIIFVLGVGLRLYLYIKTPVPLKIVATPGPKSAGGVAARMAADVALFPNLFKADKFLWLGSWIFHLLLALILFRHLRYFLYPVPSVIVDWQIVLVTAGFLFPVPALYLLWRRLALPQSLYISGLPDYVALILLVGIACTGMLVHYYVRTYLVDVKAFILGLLTLSPQAPPLHPIFLAHFALVCLLLMYFPFSKLMHVGGIFFSPPRNQRDNARDQRYVNPWNEGVK
jgi:nitrate reductase gamma subunit